LPLQSLQLVVLVVLVESVELVVLVESVLLVELVDIEFGRKFCSKIGGLRRTAEYKGNSPEAYGKR
jgi:hypothetical protein